MLQDSARSAMVPPGRSKPGESPWSKNCQGAKKPSCPPGARWAPGSAAVRSSRPAVSAGASATVSVFVIFAVPLRG
eukprot:1024760-Alexandrium_andersonii.AAC.1